MPSSQLQQILSPNPPTSILLITHSQKQPAYSLLRYIASQESSHGKKVTIICYQQSPKYYKSILGNSTLVEFIDQRFTSNTPTLPATSIVIDDLSRFNDLASILRTSTTQRIIAATSHSNTPLINTLTNISSTPTVTTLTVHPQPHYHRVRSEYGLTTTHPSFLGVLHELLTFDTLPPNQHCLSTFVVESMVRSPLPKQPLVRRSINVVSISSNGVEISEVDVEDESQLAESSKERNTEGGKESSKEGDKGGNNESSLHAPSHPVSFNLSLTSAQKAARESVPLPYLQAQQDDGAPPPAPIISYDPDSADDWDDEDPDDDLDL